MPIKFGDIRKKTLPFQFDYEVDGATEAVKGTFTPNTFTPELGEQTAGLSDEEQAKRFSETLANCLSTWDVQADDGGPYPTDKESLKKLGYHFLGATFNSLIEGMKPGERNASSSANGSSPEEASGDAQTGTKTDY